MRLLNPLKCADKRCIVEGMQIEIVVEPERADANREFKVGRKTGPLFIHVPFAAARVGVP